MLQKLKRKMAEDKLQIPSQLKLGFPRHLNSQISNKNEAAHAPNRIQWKRKIMSSTFIHEINTHTTKGWQTEPLNGGEMILTWCRACDGLSQQHACCKMEQKLEEITNQK